MRCAGVPANHLRKDLRAHGSVELPDAGDRSPDTVSVHTCPVSVIQEHMTENTEKNRCKIKRQKSEKEN